MRISLRDSGIKRLCVDALLVALAMCLSYLEYLLPLQALLPLPGFRLGLANFAITAAFCLLSPRDGGLVSAVRILLSALLFGSVTSLYFSAMGGLFAFCGLLALSKWGRRCSYLGVSVLCAALHNCGQMLAAVTLFGTSILLSYLPVLLFASVFYGGIVGILLNLSMPKLENALKGRMI